MAVVSSPAGSSFPRRPRSPVGGLVGESMDLLTSLGIFFVAVAPFGIPCMVLVVAVLVVVTVPVLALAGAAALLALPVIATVRGLSHIGSAPRPSMSGAAPMR